MSMEWEDVTDDEIEGMEEGLFRRLFAELMVKLELQPRILIYQDGGREFDFVKRKKP
jgi:hypothetical protein